MTRLANTAYHNKYSSAAQAMPKLTVYFLQASRSIRTVWLLEELGIPYALESSDRVDQKAPQAFKDASQNPMGKFPTLKDGDLVIWESGAITEYLCEKYDPSSRLIPTHPYLRTQVQTWIHAAEATFMLFPLSILYARWSFPSSLSASNPSALADMEAGMAPNVQKAMDWLEQALAASTGRFLVGDGVTAADVMMQFSVRFLMARGLGTAGRRWTGVEEWLERCEGTESYKRAVERSGHTLFPEG